MTQVTDAREDLVNALDTALSVKVHGTPPPAPVPPCAVVSCGDPWMAPTRLGALQVKVTWRILAVVRDDAAHVPALESLIEAIIGALPAGYTVETVGPPSSLDTGAQGTVMAAGVTVTAQLM
jgi:hypothetical protein